MQKWDSFSAIPYIYIYVETDLFLIWLGRTNIEKIKKVPKFFGIYEKIVDFSTFWKFGRRGEEWTENLEKVLEVQPGSVRFRCHLKDISLTNVFM